MPIIRQLIALASIVTISSCGLGGKDEDYDTGGGGYDTSDPYGVPSSEGIETAPYQAVNPPAEANPTYGAAAYEESAPPVTANQTATPTATSAATASVHTVVRGDTLWGLGKKYGVSVDAIRAVNGMAANDNNVRLGQSLNIPSP